MNGPLGILEPHRGAAIASLIGSMELIHQKIQDDTEGHPENVLAATC